MDQLLWITSCTAIVAVIAVLVVIRIRQLLQTKNNGSLKNETRYNGALRAVAISLALGGIVFGTGGFISYSFFGASILISVIDIIKSRQIT